MDPSVHTVLVTGATGSQGGAVARELLDAGWQVRGLTRDVTRDAARELELLGADMVEGDLDDRDSLDRAVEGCYGVFSVQQFWEHGVEGEGRQGRNLADAAAAAGVQVLGREVRYEQVPLDAVDSDETRGMFEWFVEEGYQADVASLRSTIPDLLDLRTWIEERYRL